MKSMVITASSKLISDKRATYKVLSYIEYRAVSGVFRTIDPPPALPRPSVFSFRTKDGGLHALAGR